MLSCRGHISDLYRHTTAAGTVESSRLPVVAVAGIGEVIGRLGVTGAGRDGRAWVTAQRGSSEGVTASITGAPFMDMALQGDGGAAGCSGIIEAGTGD